MIFTPRVLILFILILLFSVKAKSQEEPAAYLVNSDFNLYHTTKDSTALIFSNIAYIRSQPTSKSSLIDSLPIGTEVKFMEEDGLNPTSLRGMYLPWHKVEFNMNHEKKTGYIWIGLLSLDYTIDPSTGQTFMYGFAWKSPEESNYYWVEAKVLDKNRKLIGNKGFAYYPGEQSYTSGELLEPMGIEHAKNIYTINFMGEACGIASENNLFSWDGAQFRSLPKLTGVSDAGVFYYIEELIFPKDHKLGNDIILKTIEEGEAEEYELDNPTDEIKFKVSKKQETFKFDGNAYNMIAEKKLK